MPTFAAHGPNFTLAGEPFRILSGALHYFRIPRPYWHDRLNKARLLGLNTIETYAPWNLHEPTPGQFDFTGNLDVSAFIATAAQLDLRVIFRPGPYICSEWDFGGLPAWLLKDPAMRLRCSHPAFLQATAQYLAAILPHIAPHQVTRNGPVIMVQVENEYGSFGDDKTYLNFLHDTLRQHGIDTLLFTSDGESGRNLQAGTLPGLYATVNFGIQPGRALRTLRTFQPDAPLMVTEFWDGWFDHWGLWHQVRPAWRMANLCRRILKTGASLNLYMFHGGTNFGFMNGANTLGRRYLPDVTSYDYDAPLSESGDLTPKYHALRRVLSSYTTLPTDPLPAPAPKLSLPAFPLTAALSLWSALPALSTPLEMPSPEPMESLGQSYGFILYRTTLPGPQSAKLSILGLHDRAQVFLDGKPLGVLDRNHPSKKISLTIPPGGARLDLLVENMGRVNFGPHLADRKGILTSVLFGGHFIYNWQVFCLPLNDLSALTFANPATALTGPAFYRALFTLQQPLDTFLALPNSIKGIAWVNGFNLGRYWNIGPQRTLYIPAPLFKTGQNEIILFELHATHTPLAHFKSRPKL